MAIIIEVLEGDIKGTRIAARDGLTIGRKGCDLTIRDPKISSKHASVELRPDGCFWLVDLKSSNGIKTPTGRFREIILADDATFTLGTTTFRSIIGENPAEKANSAADTSSIPQEPERPKTCWDNLRDLISLVGSKCEAKKSPVTHLNPTLRLKFVRGSQTGTQWTIGYGPRLIGKKISDLQIEDPLAADICFQIESLGSRVIFKNRCGALINGKNVPSADLRHGDLIDFSNTQLLVRIDDNP